MATERPRVTITVTEEQLKEIEEYDYPKGAINFIILKDSTVYFYNEELI